MTGLADTDPVFYHVQRTGVLLELRRYERAAREARRALQHAPDHAEAHRLLAAALWGQGKLERAQSAAERALSLAPDDADVHSTLAGIQHRLRWEDEAQTHYQRALALAPQVAAFHVRYAWFLLSKRVSDLARAKTLQAAQREAETALALDPRSAAAHLAHAEALRQQRRLRQAETSIREALSISPEDARAHEMLGNVHIDLNQGAKAFANYCEALRLDPMDRAVKRKVILSMQAKLPVIGWFWRLGQQSTWGHRILWALFTAMTVFLSVQTGWSEPDLVVIYVTFYALIVLWGLFLWIIDPAITYAVTKGWIKI